MPKKAGNILLVAATESELNGIDTNQLSGLYVEKLVTGVGMVATTFALTQKLVQDHFDLVVDMGIAGAFDSTLELGEVVQVVSDRIIELGVEDGVKFIPADEMALVDVKEMLFISDTPVNYLPAVTGVTVNRVHGTSGSILDAIHQFDPDVESMEGAGVGYVCWKLGIPWVQIRAISNRVEVRNKANWNIPLALKNLNIEVTKYLKQLQDEA